MPIETLQNFQSAVFARLSGDSVIQEALGDAIYDTPPPSTLLPALYMQIGDYCSEDHSAQKLTAQRLNFDVSLYGTSAQNAQLLPLALRVQAVLTAPDFRPAGLYQIRFFKLQTYRLEQGTVKRLTNRFQARFDLT